MHLNVEGGAELTKHQLLDEAFAVGNNFSNDSLRKIRKVESKLSDYLKENGDDPQISDVLCMLKIFADESECNDFEACRKTAAPILDRLLHTDVWDFYDIRVMAAVLATSDPLKDGFASTIRQITIYPRSILLRSHENGHRITHLKMSIPRLCSWFL